MPIGMERPLSFLPSQVIRLDPEVHKPSAMVRTARPKMSNTSARTTTVGEATENLITAMSSNPSPSGEKGLGLMFRAEGDLSTLMRDTLAFPGEHPRGPGADDQAR